MRCDVCGNEMKIFSKNSTSGFICTSCGNSWLTTSIREIESDTNEYEIHLNPNNEATKDNIKLVAKIAKCNFIESRQKILSAAAIARDRAFVVQKYALELQGAKIKFKISPEFPYSTKTGEKIEHKE